MCPDLAFLCHRLQVGTVPFSALAQHLPQHRTVCELIDNPFVPRVWTSPLTSIASALALGNVERVQHHDRGGINPLIIRISWLDFLSFQKIRHEIRSFNEN